MATSAKKKAAQKWLAATLKKKFLSLIDKDLTEHEIRLLVMETMNEAGPWMAELLGDDMKVKNALEFFQLALEGDDDA